MFQGHRPLLIGTLRISQPLACKTRAGEQQRTLAMALPPMGKWLPYAPAGRVPFRCQSGVGSGNSIAGMLREVESRSCVAIQREVPTFIVGPHGSPPELR